MEGRNIRTNSFLSILKTAFKSSPISSVLLTSRLSKISMFAFLSFPVMALTQNQQPRLKRGSFYLKIKSCRVIITTLEDLAILTRYYNPYNPLLPWDSSENIYTFFSSGNIRRLCVFRDGGIRCFNFSLQK